ncbi:MAG: CPBP family intramembrane metalloprotease [Oligoflexales bacterium]|nr:CPBP family intramembrane metalloprotease [Oligoflexales bacterium]
MRGDSHHSGNQPTGTDKILQKSLVLRSTQTYGVMIGIGILVCFYLHKNLGSVFQIPKEGEVLREFGILVGLGVGLIAVFHELCKQLLSEQYKYYRTWISSVLGKISVPQALYLALLSAIGEEVLFRAALQPYLGVLWTSLILAFLHVTPKGLVPVWLLISFFTNVMVGLIFQYTQSIYPGMIIFFQCSSFALVRHAIKNKSHADRKLNSLNK